jgi:predicted nucleotidyltransferase
VTSPNRAALERIATALGQLRDEFILVGGQVAELLVTEPATTPMRTTEDVDAVCEVSTLSAYDRLAERLRALGFAEDRTRGAPLGRWRHGEDVLDVMPTEQSVLRFRNAWFRYAVRTSVSYQLSEDLTIRIASGPAFLATKWDAFGDRGRDDWYGSNDIEDIVRVVGGRPELLDEISKCDADARYYIVQHTRLFLDGPVLDVIAGAFPEARQMPRILGIVERRFRDIAEL